MRRRSAVRVFLLVLEKLRLSVYARYNRSTVYASAVLELGAAIEKARAQMQLASNRADEDALR